MALGKNLSTGRADAAQNTVMKKIRKPRFVDNAVRHAQYTKVKAGFAANKPTKTDFIPTPERRYKLIEEEDTIRLLHNPTDSMTYEGSLFYDGDKARAKFTSAVVISDPPSYPATVLPPLVVGSEHNNQALVLSEVQNATKGNRYRLENLKGSKLSDIGFTDKTIRFVQKVGVGLRTSDLAIKLGNSSKSSINGIKVKSHSGTFVARDFYGVDSINALRYLAKHDFYSPRSDRFGNLLYVPQTQIEREHFLNENRVSGGTSENNNDAVPNRVVVRGKSRANNDQNVVQVDDFGSQVDTVNEVPGGISAPTALTKASARRIGQNMLRMAKKAGGSKQYSGVLAATQVQPGDLVNYQSRHDSEKKIVLSGTYDLINRKSDLHVNSVDGTLEDVLQRFQEVDISGSMDDNFDRNRQFGVEEFSTSFGLKMKINWEIAERVDSNRGVGFNLGQPNRDTLHGARRLQSTGVLINNGAGHAIGTYLFTVDGNSATTTFSNNQEIYTKDGNKLGHVMEIASFTVGSGAYNNDPTITHASSTSIKLGMAVSGTGIPAGAYVASITSNTEFELSVSTTGGSLSGQTLTFTTTTATILAISSRSVHPVSNNDEIYLLPETLPESRNSHLKIGVSQTKYSRNRRG
jgi:hypothetical protein